VKGEPLRLAFPLNPQHSAAQPGPPNANTIIDSWGPPWGLLRHGYPASSDGISLRS
jgi:hypothetical protein